MILVIVEMANHVHQRLSTAHEIDQHFISACVSFADYTTVQRWLEQLATTPYGVLLSENGASMGIPAMPSFNQENEFHVFGRTLLYLPP